MDETEVAAVLLLAVPIVMLAVYSELGRVFDYPAILRQPAETILQKYRTAGRRLTLLWYALGITAVAFVPIALVLHLLLVPSGFPYLGVATVFGVLAGVVQAAGLLRWVFLVPTLAAIQADQGSTPARRDAALVLFEGSHLYLGSGIGEHLGYLFTGLWTVLIATAMVGSPQFNQWIAGFGFVPGVAILGGLLEPAGSKAAGAVTGLGYAVWAIWLIATGVALLL